MFRVKKFLSLSLTICATCNLVAYPKGNPGVNRRTCVEPILRQAVIEPSALFLQPEDVSSRIHYLRLNRREFELSGTFALPESQRIMRKHPWIGRWLVGIKVAWRVEKDFIAIAQALWNDNPQYADDLTELFLSQHKRYSLNGRKRAKAQRMVLRSARWMNLARKLGEGLHTGWGEIFLLNFDWLS